MRQQVSHQPCQRKDGDTDTLQYGEEETAVDVAPQLAEAQAHEQPQGRGIDAADRVDQLFIDSDNEAMVPPDTPGTTSAAPIPMPFRTKSRSLLDFFSCLIIIILILEEFFHQVFRWNMFAADTLDYPFITEPGIF